MFRKTICTVLLVASLGCGETADELPSAVACERQTTEIDCIELGCTYFVEVWARHIDNGACTPAETVSMCLVTESGKSEKVGDGVAYYSRGDGEDYEMFSSNDLGSVQGWTHSLTPTSTCEALGE